MIQALDTSRTALLVGQAGVARLAAAKVAVFGVGGVGGHVCEALVRAGVGELHLFDHDQVAPSNLNRQLVALRSTLGQPKVAVMAARAADINPACRVVANAVFYLPENADAYPLDGFDAVVDAVDTVAAKLEIICRAKAAGVPVFSSMGAGNRLRAECLQVADIARTSGCSLARVVRKELKKRGVTDVPVVFSAEEAIKAGNGSNAETRGGSMRPVPGSISTVPATAGLILAGLVIRCLLGMELE